MGQHLVLLKTNSLHIGVTKCKSPNNRKADIMQGAEEQSLEERKFQFREEHILNRELKHAHF